MSMKNKNLKRASLVNVVAGYLMMAFFVLLIMLNQTSDIIAGEETPEEVVDVVVKENEEGEVLFNGHVIDGLDPEKEIVYVDRGFVRDNDIVLGLDHPRIVDTTTDDIYVTRDDNLYVDNDRDVSILRDTHDRIHSRNVDSSIHRDRALVGRDRAVYKDHDRDRIDIEVDEGILDRRLHEESVLEAEDTITDNDKYGLDGENLGNLTLDDDNAEDIDLNALDDIDGFGKGGLGADRGDLYAYNYPSQGIGAGIGNTGVGGAVGFAGLGAGIGEAILNGKSVPALGGVGTYSSVTTVPPGTGSDTDNDGLPAETEALLGTDPNKADSDGDGFTDGAEVSSYTDPLNSENNPGIPGSTSLPTLGGVGGLASGASAAAAAGLVTGTVKEKLGTGPGCTEHGEGCDGHHGHDQYDFEHLPENGSLHIMIHVDGSGSILDTRKQLDIMKDTLLKDALLPYYNNDESLYNKRVTIVDGNGERTLQFYTLAADKDNVLAFAFQDEASPAYHLPTFNKKPQHDYSDDLKKLKASLNGYGGVYRGIMFQVDRGRTFSKSFKEMVQAAWNGEGYLASENLKKYHRDNNLSNIKNKNGIVFSDEYHAKSEGDPQYYLDLLFNASKRVGLDLNIHSGGLVDGKYNKKVD